MKGNHNKIIMGHIIVKFLLVQLIFVLMMCII